MKISPTTLHFFPSSSSRGFFLWTAALDEFTVSGDFVLTGAAWVRRLGFLWVFLSSDTCFRPTDEQYEEKWCTGRNIADIYSCRVLNSSALTRNVQCSCFYQSLGSGGDPPLVISRPWLSWANSAECWAAGPPAWAWVSSSAKTGGGPGGGGGGGGHGALAAVGGSNRQDGAIGPWRDGASQLLDSNIALWPSPKKTAVPGNLWIIAVETSVTSRGEYCKGHSLKLVLNNLFYE